MRILLSLLVAAAAFAAAPAWAESGLLSIGDAQVTVYDVSGGQYAAPVVRDANGNHLGPAGYTPLRLKVDAAGFKALKPQVDAMLGGGDATPSASLSYDGVRVDLAAVRVTGMTFPACSQDPKAQPGVVEVELRAESVKFGNAAPVPKQDKSTPPAADLLVACTVQIDGAPALAPGIGAPFSVTVPDIAAAVGELRTYEARTAKVVFGDVVLQAYGYGAHYLTDLWAWPAMAMGKDPQGLRVTYATPSGPAFTISYAHALPYNTDMILDWDGKVMTAVDGFSLTLAAPARGVTKPGLPVRTN